MKNWYKNDSNITYSKNVKETVHQSLNLQLYPVITCVHNVKEIYILKWEGWGLAFNGLHNNYVGENNIFLVTSKLQY